MWGRLDEPPGVGLLNGSTTRGDPELAVDGFDLGSYRAWGYVEALRHLPGGELADEEAKHIELAFRKLPVKLPLPWLVPAKFALPTPAKLAAAAPAAIPLPTAPPLHETPPSSRTTAAHKSHRPTPK